MVALFECAESLSEAMKIERFIKKQKSRPQGRLQNFQNQH